MKAKAQKIGEGVYWIGVLDWDLRSYHGYTLDGTTYNAYIVFGDEHVAVIDNAYPGKTAEMMARIEDAFEQEGRDEVKVDYIIQNHVELDHSGVLVDLHKRFPEAPIYCSEIAVKSNAFSVLNISVAFFAFLGIIFVILKLFKAVTWSWVWVLSPLWLSTALVVFILLICLIIFIVSALNKNKKIENKDNTENTSVDNTSIENNNTSGENTNESTANNTETYNEANNLNQNNTDNNNN